MKKLRAEALGKFYESHRKRTIIIEDTTITFSPGKSYAITGESGSGKSTFLHILSGMEKPSSGRVYLDDEEISNYTEVEMASLRRNTFGFVFQSHNLLRELNVEQNIMLPILGATGEKKSMVQMRTRWMLQHIGLENRADHLVGELSGGEMQRVAVARALIGGPQVLFADEPTGNLDPYNAKKIYKILLNYAKTSHAIVILVTHDLTLASQADFALHINKKHLSPTIQ